MPEINDKKVEACIKKLHATINKANLTVPEILVAYGNLGYHLGASMAGFVDKGPDMQTLNHEYHTNPTVDVGLMLQGLLITTWEADFNKKPILSRLAEWNKSHPGETK